MLVSKSVEVYRCDACGKESDRPMAQEFYTPIGQVYFSGKMRNTLDTMDFCDDCNQCFTATINRFFKQRKGD